MFLAVLDEFLLTSFQVWEKKSDLKLSNQQLIILLVEETGEDHCHATATNLSGCIL